MNKKIKVDKLNGLPTIHYNQLEDLQGNFKSITEENLNKLKNSIIKHGIFLPKFVWIENKHIWTVNGHQTIKALMSLEKDGYSIPEVPIIKIEADNKKDAIEKLIIINSRYGIINKDTNIFDLYDLKDMELLEIIEIPELSIDDIFLPNFQIVSEEEQSKLDQMKEIVCPKCGYTISGRELHG